MNAITPAHLSGSTILQEICDRLNDGAAEHQDTARPVVASIKVALRFNKERGRSEFTATTSATLPKGERDSVTKKTRAEFLLALSHEVEGQQRIDQ
jgi:hypothetical protein